ncbi:bifunctional 4-hydroxy-2-oxoglutarate aldolase/2-dehydro-3-deoxy-phosphogluconate aldolase [Candidatus Bathyarchaeota archaeon]|nr:MAG: bifunctional 4-hydroxy-2-oxoglutarate aldolase/2-dehydro-3-deoxy-phosphogluconate aldolase [Candidatus Bathyarchaeota archaeon]
MAKFMKHEVIGKIFELGLVPLFYNGDLEVAKKIVQACADGGAKVIEFTNRGDFAYQVFSELAKWCNKEFDDVILGVGSVIDPMTAAMYINCGANFVVSPVFNPEIAKICNRRKVPYSPGCGTVSEISAAEEMGCDIVKVFPGNRLKPAFIKSILGPCPWAKLMPTGGVDATKESISSWIKAGAVAVGMGSRLIRKDLVEAGDFEAITKLVEKCLWWVQEARGTPLFLGVEHVGIYPEEGHAAETAEWYAKIFGFEKREGRSSFVAFGKGPGRIEIMKTTDSTKCHIAIRVSNFEAACEHLKKMGIELEEPKIGKGYKAVFLKNPDPAGNRVHLLYLPP